MAENMTIRDKFFADKAAGALWDVAVSIKRGNPLPLDSNSVFQSYADLETYAAGVLAYPGQIVAVVEEAKTTIYYLDQNLAIKEVGKIPVGDNKSIEIADEKIKLKNFGDVYFKYVAGDPVLENLYASLDELNALTANEGVFAKVGTAEDFKYYKVVNGKWVEAEAAPVASKHEKTNGFVDGLEPRVVLKEGSSNEYEIAWFEPSTETVEGVSSKVQSVQTKVDTLEDNVDLVQDSVVELEDSIYGQGGTAEAPAQGSIAWSVDELDKIVGLSDATSGLKADVAALEQNKANAADVYTKSAADELLNKKADADNVYSKAESDKHIEDLEKLIADQVHFNTKIVSGTGEMTDAGTLYLVKDDTAAGNDIYAEYVLVDGVPTQIGTTETDLSDYAKSADVYTKQAANELLNNKANSADVYTKNATDELLNGKANVGVSYTKEEANNLLNNKADVSVTNGLDSRLGTAEGEIDDLQEEIAKKANAGNVYTKEEANSLLNEKANASALNDYAKTADLNETLKSYATNDALTQGLNSKLDASKEATINAAINTKLDAATYEQDKGTFATKTELNEKIGEAPVRNEDAEGNVTWEGASGIYSNIYTKDEIADLIADITGGESAADVLASLNAYKGTNDARVKAVEEEVDAAELRIKALEDVKAEANVLEGIKIGDEYLAIDEDKIATLPIAGAKLGLVKSSEQENHVAIAADGSMTVNAINIDKIAQTADTYVVLYGGSASDNI